MSPTNQKLSPESAEKEVADDDDPSEIKLQLELSEQEATVLQKKVEDLEAENLKLKNKVKELQEKIASKPTRRSSLGSDKGKDSLLSQKMKVGIAINQYQLYLLNFPMQYFWTYYNLFHGDTSVQSPIYCRY